MYDSLRKQRMPFTIAFNMPIYGKSNDGCSIFWPSLNKFVYNVKVCILVLVFHSAGNDILILLPDILKISYVFL